MDKVKVKVKVKDEDKTETKGKVKSRKKEKLRRKFIIKTLIIVAIELMITTAMCFISLYTSFGTFQLNNTDLLLLSLLLSFLPLILLACGMFREYPYNYVFLFVFVFFFSYSISAIVSFYAYTQSTLLIGLALGITVLIIIVCIMIAMFSKTDFGSWIFYLSISLIVIIFFSILVPLQAFPITNTVVTCLCILIFSFYLVADIQRLTGKSKYSYKKDEYIIAALDIYLDIISIFLELLDLLSKK
jgi:FtsH-binding integral membrane protein